MHLVEDGPALVRRIESRVLGAVIAANLAGAVVAFLDGVMGSLIYPGGVPRGQFLVRFAIATFGGITFAIVVCRFTLLRPTLRPAFAWVLEGRLPTPADHEAVVSQPRRHASRFLLIWATVLVCLYPVARFGMHYAPEPLGFVKAFIFVILSAFFAWTLCYLFVERAIRPLLSRALEVERNVSKTMGVFPRLVLGWAIIAGLPMASIAVEIAGLNSQQLSHSLPIIYTISGTSVAFGIVASWVGAYSLTEPLARLRAALRHVGGGDLDVEIPVEEAGELGEVQLGFNEMLSALRTQQRMRELFGRHVGDEVARRAIEETHGLDGEWRDVSVVFVDIIGSTAFAEQNAPDEVVNMLARFFETVVRAISGEAGLVNKFEGDGALGVFGAVTAQPDHADRALRAARALRSELVELEQALNISAAIGVSSGAVVAGNFGTSERYEYTVVGVPVFEAVRLCDEAKRTSSRLLANEMAIASAETEAGRWAEEIVDLGGGELPLLAREPVSC